MEQKANKTVVVRIDGSQNAKKVNKRPFELKEKCQDFSADIFMVTSVAQKEYRLSVCKKVQDISCEVVHAIRLANSCKLGTSSRRQAQKDALEMMERISDLLPILMKCRCISQDQLEKLEKKLRAIKIGHNAWIEKDMESLKQIKADKSPDSVQG
nr:hypothetical protein [uncultured Butyrivibrio sp.]